MLELVHQQSAAGTITPLQAQHLASALGADPSAVPIPCEAKGCKAVKPLGQMYSLITYYAVTGGVPDRAPYGCPQDQHYGCSHEHALQAAQACLASHYPSPEQRYMPVAAPVEEPVPAS